MLENRTHKDAVELFRTAGEDVELRVLKKVGGMFSVIFHLFSQQFYASLIFMQLIQHSSPGIKE